MEVNGGSEALIKMLKWIFSGLRILIIGLLIAFCVSGSFFVRENEQALVLRFGKMVGQPGQELIDSGQWHWAWPAPIDEVVRIPVKKNIRVESSTFWFSEEVTTSGENSFADDAETLYPGQGGYMLTGDVNIIHLKTVAICQIVNPIAYYLSHAKGENEQILKSIMDAATLEVLANWKMDQALYSKVDQLQQALIERTNQKLFSLKLGVGVKAFYIEKSTPPRAVISAFDEVLVSEMNKDTIIDDAFSYASRTINIAEGNASKMVEQANLAKSKQLSSLKADVFYFESLLKEYQNYPESTLVTIYNKMISEALAKAGERFILPKGSDELRLLLNREK